MNELNKIYKIVRLLFSNKVNIKFNNPPKFPFLLVDNIAEEYLYEPILKGFKYSSISTRPGEQKGNFYFTIKLFFYFIVGLKKGLNFKTSYVYACIKHIRPKVILNNTFEHNISLVAKLLPQIQFIMLSQGIYFKLKKKGKKLIKSSYPHELALLNHKKLNNLNILVWGDNDIEIFQEEGVDIKKSGINFFKVGSWQGSYYQSNEKLSEKKYDLLFVSQLHNLFLESNDKWHKQIVDNTISALKLIMNYALENNLSVGYLCRSKVGFDTTEIDVISSLFDNRYKFQIIKHESINTIWKEISRSKIILSNDSTCAHDSIALSKKVVLMPLNNTEVFRWSSLRYKNDKDFWPWTIENNEYDEFKKILDNLMNFEPDAYKKSIADRVEYMCYSKNKLPSYKNIIEFIKHRL